MNKQFALGLTCFLAGLITAVGITSQAGEDLRIEVAGGHCQHRLAADSSWSYREWGNYETNMNTKPGCYQVGVSWMPQWKGLGDTRLGLRIAYVNLGRISAANTFPIDEPEYFRAKEAREPVNSITSSFTGHGSTQGLTLGLASEYPILKLHVGPEVGVAFLYSRWKAFFPGGEEQTYGCGAGWSCADGWHATPYFGATVRYEWLQISVRRYMNAHASDATQNPLFIGPTTGPVDQIMIGFSVPFK